ncbi:YggS family pyridoxal phosphate-dependent enzyme [Flavitalea flava]
MSVNKEKYREIREELGISVQLVAVSKTKPVEDIVALYDQGQRDFGENYVQELVDKQSQLPMDIRWHFIGHLQSNKVKYIAPFVYLIHGVDSLKLLREIDKQGGRNSRVINCLLQVHIAREDTKFGFDAKELDDLMMEGIWSGSVGMEAGGKAGNSLKNVKILGLMGMASFTDDPAKVREELKGLKTLFDKYFQPSAILSMGMSGDYKIAIEEGSSLVRIGSLLFGGRG